MNCKKIKELILTDYIDNQMCEKDKTCLESHFVYCRECRDFFTAVKKAAVEPFINTKQNTPPEFIWERIKASIFAGQKEKIGFSANLKERLKGIFYIPKPVLVMSTITIATLIIVLFGVLKFANKETSQISMEEQAEYSIYSMEAPASTILNNDNGFGTLVEKYFL